jgi:LuxR family transcriptional regulator, quorum-sensing system regulator CviR
MFEALSRSELLRLMELSGDCLTATTLERIETIISSVYDLAGYEKAALCAVSPAEGELALLHYVNHSYGAPWADLYVSQRFHRVDPILIHAGKTDGVFRWDEVSPPPGGEGADLFAAAEAFGITGGISFSCAGVSPTFRSVLSFTGVPFDETERTGGILRFIGPHLHECYRRVRHMQRDGAESTDAPDASEASAEPAALPPVDLSAREREVLCWAQQGKTYWEIGTILGISQRTVKFHVARIKAKLDVVSTGHAIARAMRTGLIT